jgi:hypothetical protein
MFKLGVAKTKQGAEAFLFEINENFIFGKYQVGETWIPKAWHKGGFFVGPGFPSVNDLVPNDLPPQPKKLLAYLAKSGMVRFAVEGSQEAIFYDQDALNMTRAERFDIKESEV